MIKIERTSKGATSFCTRYFITSLKPDADQLLTAARALGLRESMHWIVDTTFNNEGKIIWNRTIAHNESLVRQITRNVLKSFRKTYKASVKTEKDSDKLMQKVLFIDGSALDAHLRKALK